MVMPYPLDVQPRQPARYFRAREEWRMTDVLMNPMVIMLLVAFLLMVLAPKLTSQDPEQLQKVRIEHAFGINAQNSTTSH